MFEYGNRRGLNDLDRKAPCAPEGGSDGQHESGT
jgi:hypothetical protein